MATYHMASALMLILSITLVSVAILFISQSKKISFFLLLSTSTLLTFYSILQLYSSFPYQLPTLQLDLPSLSLVFITGLLLLLSPLTQSFSNSSLPSLYLSLLLLGVFSYLLFSTTNLILLFICYEGSILPILYCILK